MGEPSTAMRDPIFFRWHAYIDDLFQEFKATIPSYSVQNVETGNFLKRFFIKTNILCNILVDLR